jgi:hypothetical protein
VAAWLRQFPPKILAEVELSADVLVPFAWGQDDWDVQPEQHVVQQVERFEVPAAQFDQWVFGEARAGPSKRLETQLALQVESIGRLCGLSESQKQKLLLAGRGDTKRFLESTEAARKKFEAVRRDQNAFARAWQDIQPLQAKFNTGLFGAASLFHKVLRRTLDPGQLAQFERQEAARRRFRYEAKIGLVVAALESGIPLRDEQRQKLIKVLLEETRPPNQFGQYDYYVVLYQAAQLGEEKLKPIFDDAQWRALTQLFAQMRGIEAHLKKIGVLDGL